MCYYISRCIQIYLSEKNMEKPVKQKIKSHCMGIIKKHSWMKVPVMLYMTVLLSLYYIGNNIASNGKRYSCVVLLLIFLVTGSSFASPESLHEQIPITSPAEDGAQLMAEQEINAQEVAFIDVDAIEEYEDMDYLSDEEPDIYTLEEILEDNNIDRIETNNEISDIVTTDYFDYSFDATDWRLILINKQHSIPEDYNFPLGTISGNMKCDERILEDLLAMMQGAKDDGVDLVICSPYRDYNRQTYLFKKKINSYMNLGMSYMDAYKTASLRVTSPNASEHRIGLAIDFYSSTYKSLNAGFAETETGKWLAEHSWEYGFILRYPEGKEYITGIQYEPWHFRYVGLEAATVITNKDITLEEFWEDL